MVYYYSLSLSPSFLPQSKKHFHCSEYKVTWLQSDQTAPKQETLWVSIRKQVYCSLACTAQGLGKARQDVCLSPRATVQTHTRCTDVKHSGAVFTGGRERPAECGAGRYPAAGVSSCSISAQGQITSSESTGLSAEDEGRAGARQQPGGLGVLLQNELGCHWCWLFSTFTSPGARTGHSQAKRRQHTACP